MYNYFLLHDGIGWKLTSNLLKALREAGGVCIIIPLGRYAAGITTKKPEIDNTGAFVNRYGRAQYLVKFDDLKSIVKERAKCL